MVGGKRALEGDFVAPDPSLLTSPLWLPLFPMEEIGFLYQTPGRDGPSRLTVLLWTQSSRPNNQEPINLPSFEVDYFTYFVTVMGGGLVYTEAGLYTRRCLFIEIFSNST